MWQLLVTLRYDALARGKNVGEHVLNVRILQEMVFFIINIAFGYTVIIYNYKKKSVLHQRQLCQLTACSG